MSRFRAFQTRINQGFFRGCQRVRDTFILFPRKRRSKCVQTPQIHPKEEPCQTIALLGVAVLITYSPQNGAILLIMAFLISPMGLPLAAIWLLGKVQSLKFAIQDWVYG